MDRSRALFRLFTSFLQIVNVLNKSCRWLDSNPGPLVSEATALPKNISCNFVYSDYLIDKGIVLVTINYRLGPLGFFCLENDLAPGHQVTFKTRDNFLP